MKSYLKNLIKINGPITVGQFMNEALFHPQFGYYNNRDPFGKNGDFITAPEISQTFGELIAAYFINIWQNNYKKQKISLVEMGAGKGTLMKDFLNFAKKIDGFLEIVNISIIEISPNLTKIQQENLSHFPIKWYDDFESFLQNNEKPIFFIANELFDCFAIDQFVKKDGIWQEKMITTSNDQLCFYLSKRENIKIKNGFNHSFFEYSSQASNFMSKLSQAIKTFNGIGIIIDYGYLIEYFNKYPNGTLQAVKNHQYCDILQEVGECDITALVDFSNLENIAQKNKLQTSLISQRDFLISLGIEIRKKQLLENKPVEIQNQINKAIDRLINQKEMGELFKVLIFW